MNPVVDIFVETLSPKVKGTIVGTAKLKIENEGTVMLNDQGAYAGDEQADVVLIAPEAIFRAILAGSQNPAMAFMTGKLKVEGSSMRALKISEILTS